MDVPSWILAAILRVETDSALNGNEVVPGRVKRGRDGERGATQIRLAAFRDVAKPNESFTRLDYDHNFSLDISKRYLIKLYRRFGDWDIAIMAYNAGANNYTAGAKYLLRVKNAQKQNAIPRPKKSEKNS